MKMGQCYMKLLENLWWWLCTTSRVLSCSFRCLPDEKTMDRLHRAAMFLENVDLGELHRNNMAIANRLKLTTDVVFAIKLTQLRLLVAPLGTSKRKNIKEEEIRREVLELLQKYIP